MSMEGEKPKFDLKVHIRDSKTGKIIKRQPYKLRIESGRMRYIRDGVAYHPDGSQVDKNQKPVKHKSVEEIKQELMQKGEIFDSELKKLETERAELQERLKAAELKNKANEEAQARAEAEAQEKEKAEAEAKKEAEKKSGSAGQGSGAKGQGKKNDSNESF